MATFNTPVLPAVAVRTRSRRSTAATALYLGSTSSDLRSSRSRRQPLTITAKNQSKVLTARLVARPLDGQLLAAFVERRHLGQPDHAADADDDGHRQAATCRAARTAITASGAVDSELHHHATSPAASTVTAGAADDHRQQPDQGLRRGAAGADGQLLGLRQRRHLGQPDHQPTLTTTATASSHVSGSPYTITASGAVDSGLHHQLCRREP